MFSGYFSFSEKLAAALRVIGATGLIGRFAPLPGLRPSSIAGISLRFKFQHQYLGGFPCKQLADTLEWATDSLLPDE